MDPIDTLVEWCAMEVPGHINKQTKNCLSYVIHDFYFDVQYGEFDSEADYIKGTLSTDWCKKKCCVEQNKRFMMRSNRWIIAGCIFITKMFL